MKYQKPKGTKDFFPEDKSVHDKIANSFLAIAKKYGISQIETPAFEEFDLLSAKTGPEIKEQLFMLKKRGDEVFALRPEYTGPVARLFIEKQKEVPKPIKWGYAGRMWRYEAPQKGRLREFYQLGVEIFGSKSGAAEAELISLIIDFFKSLGLTSKEFKIKINNRKILQGILEKIVGKNKIAEAFRIIDKKKKLTNAQFEAECKVLKIESIIPVLESKKIEDLNNFDLNELATEGVEELRKVFELVDKKYVELDMYIVRGLGYYTGTVFEVYDIDEKLRALAGGGRYDGMIEAFGGESCPATGFAIGMEPVSIYLKDLNKLPEADVSIDYFIAPVSESMLPKAMEIAQRLRKDNSVHVELMGRSLGKQMNYASSINAKKLVIVGEKDLKEKKVTIRDLSTGNEKKVNFDKI